VERRAQGWHGPGLTPLGHRQAAATAAHLAGRTDDVVLSSDLPRVVETARPYPVEATTDVRLRELDSGAWAGLPLADVEREHADEIARIRAGEDVPRGGAERFGDLRARIRSLLADLAAGTPVGTERSVLAFTHGGPVRALVAEVLGLPDHRVLSDPGNCSLTEVLLWIDGGGAIVAGRLVRYATDDHLAEVS
jgi:probable phosphoglycerate mutase